MPKARGILLQTTDDRGRGVYVHNNTAFSTCALVRIAAVFIIKNSHLR